jgi:predicted nucleic acid-binding Zn ribbon protein
MLQEFQEAAEKAQKRQKLNTLLFIVVCISLALVLVFV